MLMEWARKSKRKGLLALARVAASVGRACWMAAYSAWTLGETMGLSANANLRPQGICMTSLDSRLPQMVRAATTTKMTVQAWRRDHRRAGGTTLARRLKTT